MRPKRPVLDKKRQGDAVFCQVRGKGRAWICRGSKQLARGVLSALLWGQEE